MTTNNLLINKVLSVATSEIVPIPKATYTSELNQIENTGGLPTLHLYLKRLRLSLSVAATTKSALLVHIA